MKKTITLACLLIALFPFFTEAQTTIKVFDTVLFFDGYATTVATPTPPTGVIRHRNDLYARKLTSAELALIGNSLSMQVTIKAACDNYDRIGNVNLALVPAGSSTYVPDSVQRIELGRYITPFMNKNATPNTVPYNYNIDNVAALLKETSITSTYDIWIELQLFGVPYAANTEIAGCSGRSDVFYGSLDFITNTPIAAQNNNVLMPLFFQNNFNNYQTGATDTIGKTTKTITFNVANDLTNASLFLITSNHGANTGGEEYNRRNHYVYFDGTLVKTYKPGSISCEPLRMYNTQSNGIYGTSPKTDAAWQSFSNWCPGDTIPIRPISLGAVSAGSHTFKITVPTAVFNGGQGNFPLSLYLQGKKAGGTGVDKLNTGSIAVKIWPNPSHGTFYIETVNGEQIVNVTVLNNIGVAVYNSSYIATNNYSLDLNNLPKGLYFVRVKTNEGSAVQLISLMK